MNKMKLEKLNAAIWSDQFKQSLVENNMLNMSDEEIDWIIEAVKQRLNRSFRGF